MRAGGGVGVDVGTGISAGTVADADRRKTIVERVGAADWPQLEVDLDAQGWAVIPRLLEPPECAVLAALYPQAALFRSRIVMARHGFGRGEYQYFAYPLPEMVAELRAALFGHLARIANRWSEPPDRSAYAIAQRRRLELRPALHNFAGASFRPELLGLSVRFPIEHAQYLERCHAAGQCRPTPLLLQYAEGDYNCLHQDLYGEQVFALQVVILLSEPGRDFEGGEFVMTEQRPRMQSRAMVLPLRQGDAAVIAVHHRPVQGTRGVYRVNLRHGVSRVRSGQRHTLGIIFHDAA